MISEQTLKAFHRIGAPAGKEFGDPPAKKLSKLLRPAFIARPGKTLVWGDWSAIEGRVLPWLAGTAQAEKKLDIFRESDNDKSKPDVYLRTAADLLSDGPLVGMSAGEIWAIFNDKSHKLNKVAKDLRQSRGKVPELSLGFGGGLGALQAMATNYGVYVDDNTARSVVTAWRAANPWARAFWGTHDRNESSGLWGAACSALENPNTIYSAGRVAYVFDPDYLSGTLFCALPSGRLLTYPNIKWRWDSVKDKKTGKVKEVFRLSFIKGHGRSGLWYGKLAENVTQAEAASVLRRTLKRLAYEEDFDSYMPVVMHTHDEVVCEPDDDEAVITEVKELLLAIMQENQDWDEGLPLKSEIGGGWYYSKAGE